MDASDPGERSLRNSSGAVADIGVLVVQPVWLASLTLSPHECERCSRLLTATCVAARLYSLPGAVNIPGPILISVQVTWAATCLLTMQSIPASPVGEHASGAALHSLCRATMHLPDARNRIHT